MKPITETKREVCTGYDPSYYSQQIPGSTQSARLVLSELLKHYSPATVIDVGCGMGGWLAAAEELGIRDLVGVDGNWVEEGLMASRSINFSAVDLSDAQLRDRLIRLGRFDLCISVEVAEHLPQNRARPFIATLCSLADVVVFSAAIPHQGGVNHVNEQWQSYWAALFSLEDFVCHDIFRPHLWTESQIDVWYRQNIFLYTRRTHPLTLKLNDVASASRPLDLVHPEIYLNNILSLHRAWDRPSLRLWSSLFFRWLAARFRSSSGCPRTPQ